MGQDLSKTVVLLNDENDVRDYLEEKRETEEDTVLVALTPFAAYELERQDKEFKLIEDYYDAEELHRQGVENYERVEMFSDILDDSLKDKFPFLKEKGLNIFRNNIYSTKMTFDSISLRIIQIKRLIDGEKPGKICFFEENKKGYLGDDYLPRKDIDLYALILQELEWQLPQVRYRRKGERPKKIRTFFSIESFLGIISRNQFLFEVALIFRKNGLRELIDFILYKFLFWRKPQALIFGGAYNWDHVLPEIRGCTGSNPYRISNPLKVHGQMPEVGGSVLLEGLKPHANLFTLDCIDFFPIYRKILEELINSLVAYQDILYDEYSHFLERKEIKIILSSSFGDFSGHIMFQAAKKLGIPVVKWQHGNYGYLEDIMIGYMDVMDADFLLVFGQGVKKRYKGVSERFGTRTIPVGSALLEAQEDRQEKARGPLEKWEGNKTLVLYPTTNYYQNDMYVTFPPPLSDNFLWKTQKGIVDGVAACEGARIVFKFHPAYRNRDPPIEDYSRLKGYKNIRFVKNKYKFIQLLDHADIIVIDFPSTVLLQSLMTEKPIFVYTGHVKIDDDALFLLEKRVYCYSDLKKLTADVNNYIEGQPPEKDVDLNNKEFLVRYGIHEENSKEQAIGLVQAIIEGKDV